MWVVLAGVCSGGGVTGWWLGVFSLGGWMFLPGWGCAVVVVVGFGGC